MNWQWRRCCACKPRSFWRSCALWKSFQKHVYAFENKLMMMSLSSWQTTLTFILTLLCLSMLLKLNWLRSRSRPCDDDAAVVLAHYVYIHADAVIVLAQLCLYSCWCRHDCDCLVLSCRCWCQLKNVQYLFVRRVCDSSLREPHQCKNMIEETTHYFPLEHEIVLLLLLKQKDLVTQATATSPCLRNGSFRKLCSFCWSFSLWDHGNTVPHNQHNVGATGIRAKWRTQISSGKLSRLRMRSRAQLWWVCVGCPTGSWTTQSWTCSMCTFPTLPSAKQRYATADQNKTNHMRARLGVRQI